MEASESELSFLKAAGVYNKTVSRHNKPQVSCTSELWRSDVLTRRLASSQLLSGIICAGVGARLNLAPSVFDTLVAAAIGAPGRYISAAEAAALLSEAPSIVVLLPDSLPSVKEDYPIGGTAAYALALPRYPYLVAQLAVSAATLAVAPRRMRWTLTRRRVAVTQNFATWAQSAIQLNRTTSAIADSTVANTSVAVRNVLGFLANIERRHGQPELNWLLNGHDIALYASWAIDVRCARATRHLLAAHSLAASLKSPSTLAAETACVVRVLEYFVQAGKLKMSEREDVTALQAREQPCVSPATFSRRPQAGVRRLSSQLARIVKPTTTIADLTAAGRWMEHNALLDALREQANTLVADVSDSANHTAVFARRVHDMLLAAITVLDAPPNRPGCLRIIKVPCSTSPCGCSQADCLGNHWAGNTLVLVHHKTQRSRDPVTIAFPPETTTARLLSSYVDWARPLLIRRDTDALFLSLRGAAFESDSGFGAYLPSRLQGLGLPKLSFTTVRHGVRHPQAQR